MPSTTDATQLPVRQWRDIISMEPGVRLTAAGWIPEEPRAIVLLCHGHVEHLGRYGHIVAALVAQGFAVYGLDHRGHGRSSGPRALILDYDRIADDLHALAVFAAARHPGLPTVIVGHSMGGLIALRYTLKYQQELRALVTSGPALIIDEGVPELQVKAGRVIAAVAPMAPLRRGGGTGGGGGCGLSTDPEVCQQFRIDHRNWHGPTRTGTAVEMHRAAEDTRNRLAEITVPLLAMHGADDTTTYPRGSQMLYDRASSEDKTLRMWDGHRHEIFNSPGRTEVIAFMLDWLDERVT
jgi:lysophospholipase